MNIAELKLTPKRKEICEMLDLKDSDEILSYYPYRYETFVYAKYEDWKVGETYTFDCELISYPSTFRYGKRTTSRFKVFFEENELLITIFNRPWIRDLNVNDHFVVVGRYDGANKVTAMNYYKKELKDVLGIQPVYSVKDAFKQSEIRKLIEYTYNKVADSLCDDIPSKFVSDHGLISHREAIYNIHNPIDGPSLKKAYARLKYEEFLRFYVALDILNEEDNGTSKKIKTFDRNKINELINELPYEMTPDQVDSVNDVLKDLESSKPMNRLLQGEVGSGKTTVALIGLYANYLAGYRGALMAPTEILAKQHYEEMKNYLEPFGVKVGCLYSSLTDIKEVKKEISEGVYDIVIGTHALFSDDVCIDNLGFVITDEQHRFGVKQRRKLKEKGDEVDFLMMSATPIPRTLASSIYGDMAVSTIETMPVGRKGCDTILIKKNSIVDILPDIKKTLAEGRQVYIIAAAIDENSNYSAKDVTHLYESLKDALSPYKLSFLHGRLSAQEKDEVMSDFKENRVQVLVSTTVVEVGVNVKNATMMIIYDADKFGMSQLHQLRGRVQRSSYRGTCYLLTGSDEESVMQRLNVLVQTNNGFEISMEDLKLRGPGDILGTRQAGLPSFILGNLITDTKFIEGAKKDAREIIENRSIDEYGKYYDRILAYQRKNYGD